jgi:ribosome-associated protein
MPKNPSEKIVQVLEDLKAKNIKVLDVRKLTSVTDFMIIAGGRSSRNVKALADKVVETAKLIGMEVIGIEGHQQAEWILIDLGDIVVHVMQEATRDYYQLEKLWSQDSPGSQARTS